MPKQPVDYSKTIIYRIVCKNPEIKDCYIGSTTDFKSRKQKHKHNCNCETSKGYNYNVYTFIRGQNGWDNWEMLEIEKYKAIDQPDQAKRERYWLEFYNATLNSQVPSRTHGDYLKEYYEENKEQIQEYKKKYREDNKDYFKVYREKNKEHHKEYHKEYSKKYREENKEHKMEYSKNYREINKEQIKLKYQEKITCCCGSVCGKYDIKKHELTKKHIQFIEQNK